MLASALTLAASKHEHGLILPLGLPGLLGPTSCLGHTLRWNVEMGLGHLLPGPNPATENALSQAVKNINWADPNKFNPAHFIMGGQN